MRVRREQVLARASDRSHLHSRFRLRRGGGGYQDDEEDVGLADEDGQGVGAAEDAQMDDAAANAQDANGRRWKRGWA